MGSWAWASDNIWRCWWAHSRKLFFFFHVLVFFLPVCCWMLHNFACAEQWKRRIQLHRTMAHLLIFAECRHSIHSSAFAGNRRPFEIEREIKWWMVYEKQTADILRKPQRSFIRACGSWNWLWAWKKVGLLHRLLYFVTHRPHLLHFFSSFYRSPFALPPLQSSSFFFSSVEERRTSA